MEKVRGAPVGAKRRPGTGRRRGRKALASAGRNRRRFAFAGLFAFLLPVALLFGAGFGAAVSGLAAPGGAAEGRDSTPPIAWAELETPPPDLAAVHRASRIENAGARRTALEAIADDAALAARTRAAASFRLGRDALRRGRWTEAAERLGAPEVLRSALAADALHLLAANLPGAKRDEAISHLETLVAEHPDYRKTPAVRLLLGQRLAAAGRREEALPHFEAAAGGGADLRGDALAARAAALERLGRFEDAARALETLYYDLPTHTESLTAGRRLTRLYRSPNAASPPAEERYPRAMDRAAGFASAGNHRRAHENYREIARRFSSVADAELVRLRIGISEFHRGRLSASLRTLARITREDLRPAALYYRGESLRRLERLTTQSRILEELLEIETEHPYGARALYSLARARLAANDREAAVPYLRRLADGYPHSARAVFAVWHDLWDLYRNGDFERTAPAFERAAREHPGDFRAGQFLYFSGRARERLGRGREAAERYREVVLGYRNSFYGRRAADRLAASSLEEPAVENPITERGLLLDRFRVRRNREAALVVELHAAGASDRAREAAAASAGAGEPDDAAFRAMEAWLLSREGKNVPSIQAMRQAAPFFTSAAGDFLPEEYWRLLYPLRYIEGVKEQSARRNLDPFLVAGLIRQESAFAPRTRSPVGARGLMQIMPGTGRALARVEGLRWRLSGLYDPGVNIRFGTRYLRQLLDRFGGRRDYALAGYNAGPHRVRDWTGMDLEIASERFIEEIPFTETRNYVKLILRNEMLYRRLYPELAEPPAEAAPDRE